MPFVHTSKLNVIERLEGKAQIARPGVVAIVPSNARHSVRALTDGRLIVVDYPARPEFG
jgi:quercetin dioxygenase-like cupin family protein